MKRRTVNGEETLSNKDSPSENQKKKNLGILFMKEEYVPNK